MKSNSILSVHVLPEKVRDSHSKLVSVATEQAIKALEEIKKQLCNDGNPDFEKLMESVGIFFQQAIALCGERRQFTRSQSSDE
ncbi:MAG: hypothetical protein QXG67_02625 [Candidatus Nitrosotenuis sp.]